MVFRYPPKPSMDYIKRVVGVPGDEVAYLNKKLTLNGKPVQQGTALPEFSRRGHDAVRSSSSEEELGERQAASCCSMTTHGAPALIRKQRSMPFPNQP